MITSAAFAQAEMQYRQARLVGHEIESYRRTRRGARHARQRRWLHRAAVAVGVGTA